MEAQIILYENAKDKKIMKSQMMLQSGTELVAIPIPRFVLKCIAR